MKAVIAVVMIALSACGSRHEICTESRIESVTTYPYQAYTALGPEYSGMALIPVQEDTVVCTKWQEVKQ